MIDDLIRERVTAHYDKGDEILLLSDLGTELRNMGVWPPDGDSRTLFSVVDSVAGVTAVRDSVHKAFVIVVPDSRRELALAALEERLDQLWLKRLPRAALVAFCVDISAERPLFLKPSPPVEYALDQLPTGSQDFLPIEPIYRTPGLFVRDLNDLEAGQRKELAGKMRAWCAAHGVDPESLTKGGQRPGRSKEVAVGAPAVAGANALERLLAAQVPEVAAKIILPIDIALSLSRLP